MAQATSYNLLNDPHGVRQDIKDIVRRVEPEKTPMYSLTTDRCTKSNRRRMDK